MRRRGEACQAANTSAAVKPKTVRNRISCCCGVRSSNSDEVGVVGHLFAGVGGQSFDLQPPDGPDFAPLSSFLAGVVDDDAAEGAIGVADVELVDFAVVSPHDLDIGLLDEIFGQALVPTRPCRGAVERVEGVVDEVAEAFAALDAAVSSIAATADASLSARRSSERASRTSDAVTFVVSEPARSIIGLALTLHHWVTVRRGARMGDRRHGPEILEATASRQLGRSPYQPGG
jgi:hypothetical protein